jgi:ribosomal protein S8
MPLGDTAKDPTRSRARAFTGSCLARTRPLEEGSHFYNPQEKLTRDCQYTLTLPYDSNPCALRRWLSTILFYLIYYYYPGYIGEFEIIDDHRSNKIVIELNGRLNKCGVISPRFDVPVHEIEKWVVNLLPSRQFGHIILSTTYGIMTHEEARRKKTGGKILGFFY